MLFGPPPDQRWLFKVPKEVKRTNGSKTLWEDDSREIQYGLKEEAVENIFGV